MPFVNTEIKEKPLSTLFNEPYKDGLYQLVIYYASRPDPIKMILKFSSIRSVIEGFYQVLTNYKELDPIESLPEQEKKRIWKLTKGSEERLKASKAIYLMEKILK